MSFVTQVGQVDPISLDVLQVNVGKLCNKTCSHCHIEAGPTRDEVMTKETMSRVLWLADQIEPSLVDITGGAPEMNPDIRWFIQQLGERDLSTQLRTNLTALLLDESIIQFFAYHGVKLVASLPCYEAAEVDSVRGVGTFDESIRILRLLNEAGYGRDPGLVLDLVFNPEADFLPPPQASLEETYRKHLMEDFGVVFTNLITITNMPVGRFRDHLERLGQLEDYMGLLRGSFNPETVDALMCRHQVNVDWDGRVYDCDFNLSMDYPMRLMYSNINDPGFNVDALLTRSIVYGEHCYGCTAGQGSSCSGALTG